MTGVAAREREALVGAMRRLGPDAPTLCSPWTTHDLAAHLVARDRRPDSLAGLVLPQLADYTEKVRVHVAARYGYDELLGMVERGPAWGRLGVPGTMELFNVHEFFVHHEDVRRANGEGPRAADADRDRALWGRLERVGRRFFRRVHGLEVTLVRPDGARVIVARGPARVTLRGPVDELFLYAFNRKDVAQLEIDGGEEHVEQLVRTTLGS